MVEVEVGGVCKSLVIMFWWLSICWLGFFFIFKVLIYLGSFLWRVNGICEFLCFNLIVSFFSDIVWIILYCRWLVLVVFFRVRLFWYCFVLLFILIDIFVFVYYVENFYIFLFLVLINMIESEFRNFLGMLIYFVDFVVWCLMVF